MSQDEKERVVVLPDGDTFSTIEGCIIADVDLEPVDADLKGLDPTDIIEQNLKEQEYEEVANLGEKFSPTKYVVKYTQPGKTYQIDAATNITTLDYAVGMAMGIVMGSTQMGDVDYNAYVYIMNEDGSLRSMVFSTEEALG